ncbi:MAG TPA: bifunctional nuclease domain-containing protein [Streptosporangiaceae bacterium]
MSPFDAAQPHAQPDAELVAAALRGAREALAELIGRHWDTAVLLAARVLGSAELARDAAQEAAVAAMTDLGRLRSPERFGAWFCGIALNVARRWRRQLRLEVPGAPADLVSASPGPAELAEAADMAARVRDAVTALAAGQQHAVLLFYLQGLSHREVAAELGISVGAVKSRLHQARAALEPVLAPVADLPRERTSRMTRATGWVDVAVTGIRRTDGEDATRRKHIMILGERGGERWLPVWIGPFEAIALALRLEAVETPRPLTYGLAASLVEAAGARVTEVRIARLLDEVFYAAVLVDGPAGVKEVDARPSDAVNLALTAGAPIRVDSELFGPGLAAVPPDGLPGDMTATATIADEARRMMQVPPARHPDSGPAGK